MLFKGTATRPPGSIAREVERVGGHMNAVTSLDYTYYHLLLPSGEVTAGIEMLGDISVGASFDPAELEREKLVVLEEMRRAEDNPRTSLARQLHRVLFDGHPYARPVIGTAAIVGGLTRDVLQAYYRARYGPEAFTLVVVGAVDAEDVLATATRVFGRLPRGGPRRDPVTPVSAVAPRQLEVARPDSHAYLGMSWLAPALGDADAVAASLLSWVLGEARSSRLTTTLRDTHGSVAWVGSSYAAHDAGGALSVVAQLDARNLARAEQEVLAEIGRVQEAGLTEPEHRRAITAAEAAYVFLAETPDGLARAYGRAETAGRLDEELAYLDRVRAVTREQIQAVARRFLAPGRYARVVLLPQGAR